MNIEAGAKVYSNKVIDKVIDDDITPYYLRYAYCTRLAERGIDVRVAQYLMGHASIEVTLNIYTDVKNSTKLVPYAAKKLQDKTVKRKFKLKRI